MYGKPACAEKYLKLWRTNRLYSEWPLQATILRTEKKETERLVMNFKNGINTILISPRRWGKTSLVQKACNLAQSDKLKIVYIDIFSCRSDRDFYNAFASAVLKQTSSKVDEWLENIKLFLSRISPKISLGPDPTIDFSISLEMSPKDADIDEILQLPEKIAQKKRDAILWSALMNFSRFRNSGIPKRSRNGCVLYGSCKKLCVILFVREQETFDERAV